MLNKTLAPKEKRLLDRCIDIVSNLARRGALSEINAFAVRERTRIALKILGAKDPSRVLITDGIDIIRDGWPFKVRRLRKLINGRRRPRS